MKGDKRQFPAIKTTCAEILLVLLTLPAAVQGQFTYTTNNGTITITKYTGSSAVVNIPSTIHGLPVTSIGNNAFVAFGSCTGGCTGLFSVTIPSSVISIGSYAFSGTSLTNVTIGNGVTSIGTAGFYVCRTLTNLTIPSSVTNIGSSAFSFCISLTNVTIPKNVISIGDYAFRSCSSLSAITVDALNAFYSSVDGVLFDKNQTTLIQCPGGKSGSYTIPDCVANIGSSGFSSCIGLTNVTIPNSVTSIGTNAFSVCLGLTRVTIGSSVTNIGYGAFKGCTHLTGLNFLGNAPSDSYVLASNDKTIVYYLPETTGWGPTFGGRPTALWLPQVQTTDPSFGVRTNQFGFNIAWASGQVVVVEVCPNLANPIWSPLQTNTLSRDTLYFSDPQWTNYPARFYRVRSP